MYLAEFIRLQRNWQKDQKIFEKAFDLFAPRHGLPVYLVIFPEGSRLTEKKLKASQEYARANQLPILHECLLPRSKGLVATIKGLRAANTAVRFVYDITLAYYHPSRGFGVAPSFLDMALGRLEGYRFHVHVERIPISDLPLDDEGLTKWTMDRFSSKDELLGRLREAYESNHPK